MLISCWIYSHVLRLPTTVQGSLNRVPLSTFHRLRELGLCTAPPTKRGTAGGSQIRAIRTNLFRPTKVNCAYKRKQTWVNWSNLKTLQGLHITVLTNGRYATPVSGQNRLMFTNIVAVHTDTNNPTKCPDYVIPCKKTADGLADYINN